MPLASVNTFTLSTIAGPRRADEGAGANGVVAAAAEAAEAAAAAPDLPPAWSLPPLDLAALFDPLRVGSVFHPVFTREALPAWLPAEPDDGRRADGGDEGEDEGEEEEEDEAESSREDAAESKETDDNVNFLAKLCRVGKRALQRRGDLVRFPTLDYPDSRPMSLADRIVSSLCKDESGDPAHVVPIGSPYRSEHAPFSHSRTPNALDHNTPAAPPSPEAAESETSSEADDELASAEVCPASFSDQAELLPLFRKLREANPHGPEAAGKPPLLPLCRALYRAATSGRQPPGAADEHRGTPSHQEDDLASAATLTALHHAKLLAQSGGSSGAAPRAGAGAERLGADALDQRGARSAAFPVDPLPAKGSIGLGTDTLDQRGTRSAAFPGDPLPAQGSIGTAAPPSGAQAALSAAVVALALAVAPEWRDGASEAIDELVDFIVAAARRPHAAGAGGSAPGRGAAPSSGVLRLFFDSVALFAAQKGLSDGHAHRLVPALLPAVFACRTEEVGGPPQSTGWARLFWETQVVALPCLAILRSIAAGHEGVRAVFADEVAKVAVLSDDPHRAAEKRAGGAEQPAGDKAGLHSGRAAGASPLVSVVAMLCEAVTDAAGASPCSLRQCAGLVDEVFGSVFRTVFSPSCCSDRSARVRASRMVVGFVQDLCGSAEASAVSAFTLSIVLKHLVSFTLSAPPAPPASATKAAATQAHTAAKSAALACLGSIAELLLRSGPRFAAAVAACRARGIAKESILSAYTAGLQPAHAIDGGGKAQVRTSPDDTLLVTAAGKPPEDPPAAAGSPEGWGELRTAAVGVFPCSVHRTAPEVILNVFVAVVLAAQAHPGSTAPAPAAASVACKRTAIRELTSMLTLACSLDTEQQPRGKKAVAPPAAAVSADPDAESYSADGLLEHAGGLLRKALAQTSPVVKEAALGLVPILRGVSGKKLAKGGGTGAGNSSRASTFAHREAKGGNVLGVYELLALLRTEKSVGVVRKVIALLKDVAGGAPSGLRVTILGSIIRALFPLLSSSDASAAQDTRLKADVKNLVTELWLDPKRQAASSVRVSGPEATLCELALLVHTGDAPAVKWEQVQPARKYRLSFENQRRNATIAVLRSSATKDQLSTLLTLALSRLDVAGTASLHACLVLHAVCLMDPSVASSYNTVVLLGKFLRSCATLTRSCTPPQHEMAYHAVSSVYALCRRQPQVLADPGSAALAQHLFQPAYAMATRPISRVLLSSAMRAVCGLVSWKPEAPLQKEPAAVEKFVVEQLIPSLVNSVHDKAVPELAYGEWEDDRELAGKLLQVERCCAMMAELCRHLPPRVLSPKVVEKWQACLSSIENLGLLRDPAPAPKPNGKRKPIARRVREGETLPPALEHHRPALTALVARNKLSLCVTSPAVCFRRYQPDIERALKRLSSPVAQSAGPAGEAYGDVEQIFEGLVFFLRDEAAATEWAIKTDDAESVESGMGAVLSQLYLKAAGDVVVLSASSPAAREHAISYIFMTIELSCSTPIISSEILATLSLDPCFRDPAEHLLSTLVKRYPTETRSRIAPGIRDAIAMHLAALSVDPSSLTGTGAAGSLLQPAYSILQATLTPPQLGHILTQLLRPLVSPDHLTHFADHLLGRLVCCPAFLQKAGVPSLPPAAAETLLADGGSPAKRARRCWRFLGELEEPAFRRFFEGLVHGLRMAVEAVGALAFEKQGEVLHVLNVLDTGVELALEKVLATVKAGVADARASGALPPPRGPTTGPAKRAKKPAGKRGRPPVLVAKRALPDRLRDTAAAVGLCLAVRLRESLQVRYQVSTKALKKYQAACVGGGGLGVLLSAGAAARRVKRGADDRQAAAAGSKTGELASDALCAGARECCGTLVNLAAGVEQYDGETSSSGSDADSSTSADAPTPPKGNKRKRPSNNAPAPRKKQKRKGTPQHDSESSNASADEEEEEEDEENEEGEEEEEESEEAEEEEEEEAEGSSSSEAGTAPFLVAAGALRYLKRTLGQAANDKVTMDVAYGGAAAKKPAKKRKRRASTSSSAETDSDSDSDESSSEASEKRRQARQRGRNQQRGGPTKAPRAAHHGQRVDADDLVSGSEEESSD
ncbi:hypothetical protein DIPPA_23980 [Diplonema papillatum]|nr:hypothetical protein DIPPA_23980 [Diplonema papillatum]